MSDLNAYAILGVAPGASVKQIKDAYRRAVLQYHPDRSGGDARSLAYFQRLSQAYRSILSSRQVGLGTRAISPDEMAFGMGLPLRHKSVAIRRNENRLFLAGCIVAVLLGLAVTLIAMRHFQGDHDLDGVAVVALSLGTYFACLVACLLGIVLTRKVLTFVFQLNFRRALPRPQPPQLDDSSSNARR